MKSSATARFETPWAVGIITLVWKFFIAHDSTPGTVKETMWWNDVLTMEILVRSYCGGIVGDQTAIIKQQLAIDLAIQQLIWQSNLAIRLGNLIWRFDLRSIWQFDLAVRFNVVVFGVRATYCPGASRRNWCPYYGML
jgi:hypothetical protein